MKALARIIRGTVGIATTWALSWGALAFTLALLTWVMSSWTGGFLAVAGPITLAAVFGGAVAGKVFALALATLYHNRSLSDLRPYRMALFGALGGALVPALIMVGRAALGLGVNLGVGIAALAASSVLGAAMAAGSVKLAQLATPRLPVDQSMEQLRP